MGLTPGECTLEVAIPKRRDAKKRPSSQQVLVHDCFDQSCQDQPDYCPCLDRISEQEARRLITKGLASWLRYTRRGKTLQSKKSLVLTPKEAARRAHSHDALNHKFGLSITNFNSIPGHERIQSGVSKEIEAVRLQAIDDHPGVIIPESYWGADAHGRRRARWANERKGSGGLMVGVNGEAVLDKQDWSYGNSPEYDGGDKPSFIWEIVSAEEARNFEQERGDSTFFQSSEGK